MPNQMITKPDANPILLAILNVIMALPIGYFMMGQQKKGIIALAICWGPTILTCGFCPFLSMACFVFAYDAYLLGQKLQSGQSIGVNENGLDFLNAIFKD